jgi:hypothetical protein
VNNSVTLQPGSTTLMEIDRSAGTNDQLRLPVGTLNCAGSLVVTNLAGALAAGDRFPLFEAATITGLFQSTNLPPLDAGLAWNFNPASGVLSVVATSPTNLTFAVSGGNLTLAWPQGHTGWRLQAQTNSLAVGLNPNWFDVAGAAATNTVSVPLDATRGSVFYRLVYP